MRNYAAPHLPVSHGTRVFRSFARFNLLLEIVAIVESAIAPCDVSKVSTRIARFNRTDVRRGTHRPIPKDDGLAPNFTVSRRRATACPRRVRDVRPRERKRESGRIQIAGRRDLLVRTRRVFPRKLFPSAAASLLSAFSFPAFPHATTRRRSTAARRRKRYRSPRVPTSTTRARTADFKHC